MTPPSNVHVCSREYWPLTKLDPLSFQAMPARCSDTSNLLPAPLAGFHHLADLRWRAPMWRAPGSFLFLLGQDVGRSGESGSRSPRDGGGPDGFLQLLAGYLAAHDRSDATPRIDRDERRVPLDAVRQEDVHASDEVRPSM